MSDPFWDFALSVGAGLGVSALGVFALIALWNGNNGDRKTRDRPGLILVTGVLILGGGVWVWAEVSRYFAP